MCCEKGTLLRSQCGTLDLNFATGTLEHDGVMNIRRLHPNVAQFRTKQTVGGGINGNGQVTVRLPERKRSGVIMDGYSPFHCFPQRAHQLSNSVFVLRVVQTSDEVAGASMKYNQVVACATDA